MITKKQKLNAWEVKIKNLELSNLSLVQILIA